MELKRFFTVWLKYQQSLNWLNIVFRYGVKLLLVLNLVVIFVSVAYKYKDAINHPQILIVGMTLTDLLAKLYTQKHRQDVAVYRLLPNGRLFLTGINILQDIFSLRNLILPTLTSTTITVLGFEINSPIVVLLALSCLNNIVAGRTSKTKRFISAGAVALLAATTLFLVMPVAVQTALTFLTFAVLLFFRYHDKSYVKSDSINNSTPGFAYQVNCTFNSFLWLEFQILKHSKHLQLTLVKVIAVATLYCYLISTRYDAGTPHDFFLILLIQVYYSLAPLLLLPYVLSSNHGYIGLLMTGPNIKSFFATKLNVILMFQFLLTLLLCGMNYNDMQTLYLVSSISLFNVTIVTPILFIGVMLTDEKANIFDSGTSSFIYIAPFVQSMYFLAVLIGVALFLYVLHYTGLNIFSWSLVLLSVVMFIQKERFWKLFAAQFRKKKYQLFKVLS